MEVSPREEGCSAEACKDNPCNLEVRFPGLGVGVLRGIPRVVGGEGHVGGRGGGGGGGVREGIHDSSQVRVLEVTSVEGAVGADAEAEGGKPVHGVGLGDDGGADVGAREFSGGCRVGGEVGCRGGVVGVFVCEVLGSGDLVRERSQGAHPGPVGRDAIPALVAAAAGGFAGGGESGGEAGGEMVVGGEGAFLGESGLAGGSGIAREGGGRGWGMFRLGVDHFEVIAKRREGRESVHVLGEEVGDHRGVGGAAVEVEDGEGHDKFLADAAGEHEVEVEAGLFDGGHVGDAGGGGGDGADERMSGAAASETAMKVVRSQRRQRRCQAWPAGKVASRETEMWPRASLHRVSAMRRRLRVRYWFSRE